jgi:hypothetical protein
MEHHPTVLDTPCGTQDDGEPLVFLESDEPAVKRRRDYKDDAQCNEKIPREFMAEWVATPKGILPFVKNMETGVVHCGFVKMKVLHFKSASGCDDYKSVVCLDGCDTVDCKKKAIQNVTVFATSCKGIITSGPVIELSWL